MGSRTERLHFRALKVALAIAFLVTATSAPINVVRAAEGDDLINQGMTQNTSGNYPAAINAFERYLQLYPNGASVNQAHLYAGHAYMLQNKYITNAEASSAQNHFNAILRQGPSARFFKEALFHTAHLAYEMRNYADAKSRFEEFLRQYPNDGFNVYVYYYLANCEKQLGNNRNAIAYYEQALSKDPTSALNWNCRLEHASLVGKTGDYNAAERELATLATTPNLPADIAGQVAVQRALLQIVQQKYDNAIEILERYVSTYKSYDDSVATDAMAAVYLHEAYAYTAKRQIQQALNVIERNLERNNNTSVNEAAL
ncbi:MAG: tetratricopeptide repeat protein [Thermoguttaceae bacterium]|nr:tetratricopeptide repeat protein [Thermoguttaceae bacterium]